MKTIKSPTQYVLFLLITAALAAGAQYDTRLTHINMVTGEMTVGNGREMGWNEYTPDRMFTAQIADPPLRGVTVRC